jgi:hypothetical protein
MKQETSDRPGFHVSWLLVLALVHPAIGRADDLLDAERKIMDTLVQSYGATDWSAVVAGMVANPNDGGNPNIMVIPLSLGNVYLNRYEASGDANDLQRAAAYIEWTAGSYGLWNQRWLTPAVAQYLAISVLRLRAHETVVGAERLDALWAQTAAILEQEADARLLADLPYRNSTGSDPYDSSSTGNTRAEENAWEAGVLAAAASFLPEHARAEAWDQKARQLAYDAITRPSDPADAVGIKTTTVTEDFSLSNHGFFPNPYYTVGTLFLLCQGALGYRLAGLPVPEEFQHNVAGLFAGYRGYVDADLRWTVPSDPTGDASLFPLPWDADFERAVVRKKAAGGSLWEATDPVAWLTAGPDLWRAVQNSKVVMYYLIGSYLWHFAPAAPAATSLP